MNLNSLKFFLNMILNKPSDEKVRKLQTTNQMLKAIINKNAGTVEFLETAGFTKQGESSLVFQKKEAEGEESEEEQKQRK